MATPNEIQTAVNRIQAKLMLLERATNALHEALYTLLRDFEKHNGMPPNTIRPYDGDPKPKP
jgi:hypothetical protein